MICSDAIRTLEERAAEREDEIDRLTMRLAVLEDFAATIKAIGTGNWIGGPTHAMLQVVEALEMVK